MNTNKTAILISIAAIIVFGLAACLGHSNAALFDSCVLLLTCALGTRSTASCAGYTSGKKYDPSKGRVIFQSCVDLEPCYSRPDFLAGPLRAGLFLAFTTSASPTEIAGFFSLARAMMASASDLVKQ